MLKKGSIRKFHPSKGEFVSNLFLEKKKDGGQRPVVNLKQLNAFIPYCHFKMEGLQNLKYMLQKGDYIYKLDLKDAYFWVPLDKNSGQFVRFRWSGNLCEFLLLLFWSGTSTTNIHKIAKKPMTILRRINIRIIIYSDNMLLIGHSLEGIMMSWDTVVFFLQHLGSAINWKRSECKK